MNAAEHAAVGSVDPQDDLSRAFGRRVRGLRERANLTLDQLSRNAGVSRAMLSKIERGEKSPTIGVATRISHALHTSLSFLTGAEEQRRAVVVIRKDERRLFRDEETGFERHLLSPPFAGSSVELLYHYLPAGTSTGTLPFYPHGTQKHIVVTEGELVVTMPDVEMRLSDGDALFFEAETEHAFENRARVPCRYFLVISRRDTLFSS